MKKLLLIQAHPDPESYCQALGEFYMDGIGQNAEVQTIIIRDLEFSPNLKYGYRKRTELEPDLLDAWEKIKWADHITIIHPLWWGGLPAMAKGFFDRLFLPGFAFQKKENTIISWEKLLKGKTGRVIATMDQPAWYYWLYYWAPGIRAVKKLTFEFTGIEPVKVTSIGPIRLSKDSFRSKWLTKVNQLGKRDSR
ncbi:NAD(P)H-dependent oxidoreductase [Jiulongibacter sediminis]|uniref:NADPH-quinone reductase n=1 Tax=Jiulongibacter sediminis TaxID=1605367 RepID=A0A0P7C7S2_9BACT|nr:NAD(P)H-dependent oxidoreductase [Jiulongibacter sediminis]KPM48495.1 NADPH-quinone reductase [Jiulongibacter sediminis]TBX25033.1 NADPH-quinone reductase [Jiulongibacter sediminis]